MLDLVSKEQTRKIVCELLGELSVKYSYYQLSILLDVNEKTIYKWRTGNIPKADNFMNLQILHNSIVNK